MKIRRTIHLIKVACFIVVAYCSSESKNDNELNFNNTNMFHNLCSAADHFKLVANGALKQED